MISAFLLAKSQQNTKYSVSRDAIEKVALPIAVDTLQSGSEDVFGKFLKAIYEDYDIEKAIKIVDDIKKTTDEDLLLKNFSAEIVKQAYLVIFNVKCKLFKTISTKEFQKYLKEDKDIEELKTNLLEDGYDTVADATTISCKQARNMDAEI